MDTVLGYWIANRYSRDPQNSNTGIFKAWFPYGRQLSLPVATSLYLSLNFVLLAIRPVDTGGQGAMPTNNLPNLFLEML